MRCLCTWFLLFVPLVGQDLDIYGYFEPQYTGLVLDGNYYHFQANKLRVDLESKVVKNIEFGADFIFNIYFGKKDWNLLNFLPDRISSTIPPEMQQLYQYNFKDTFFLDNLYARLASNRLAVTVGKQQISFGSGYFANPTDLYNRKDVLDPTYEQPGHNGIRCDLSLTNRLNSMIIFSPIESEWKNTGKFGRIKLGVGHFDLSIVGGEIQCTTTDFYTFQQRELRRRVVGGDLVGEILGLGVWGEGAYNFLEDSTNFYEFIVGLDYTFNSNLYALLEYHHNSLGKTDYDDYDLNDWMRFLTGEQRTIGRDQIYGYLRYPLSDLVNIGSSVITNISDLSGVVVPSLNYNIFENIDLALILNLYLGSEEKAFNTKFGSGGLLRAQVYF